MLLILDNDGFIPVLDHANLAFHEAGHVFFGIFGDVANLYGGTLGQFVFPLVIVISFWLRRQPIGYAVGWIWFFENWRYVATYVADARARVLPMAGTGPKIHDWWAILRRWDALQHDTKIASVFNGLALAGILAAVLWLVWRSLRKEKTARLAA
ncbi:MAG TPA: hypothetical protein VM425_07885 [Myxococcota bacterium]|nr:hypothetical protein [Myxococcota bacterium]